MEYLDICFIGIELVVTLLLFWVAGHAEKVLSPKWRLSYVLPLVVALVFAGLTGFEVSLLPIFIGAFASLAGFLWEDKRIRRGACALMVLLILLSIPICMANPGYRKPDYLKDFEKGFAELKIRYDLTNHKGIDWDAKYAEYKPRFAEVQKSHDKVENMIVWTEFCNSFHDGHVSYSSGSTDAYDLAMERQLGNDYGLSLMTLAGGDTVALNVEEGSVPYNAGIRNGTVITAWDGRAVADILAAEELPAISPFPVKENEEFWSALTIAGTGGDEVAISYIDDDGAKQTVTAPRIGSFYKRCKDTYETIQKGKEGGNLSWEMVNEETACLRLTQMMYDSQSYSSGEHTEMQNEIREKILELKQAGVKNLIFDLRSNGGGSPHFVMAIAGLVAPEGEHILAYDGVWNEEKHYFEKNPETGKYIPGNAITYYGENLWEDGEIVLLVNNDTISSGDMMTKIMGSYDNVTVMGFTHTNCSGQAISVIEMEAGILSFSAIPELKENGDINIDTGIDRKATIDVDVIIPFDEDAVHAIFDEGEDYIVRCAVEYLRTVEE